MQKPTLLQSFGKAFLGIYKMLKSERNFQIEVVALCINIFLIWFFALNLVETSLIILSCFMVLAAEIFNTAIEKICDFIQPNFDHRIGFIKDISAGAVLLLSFAAIIVGILVYHNYVIDFLN